MQLDVVIAFFALGIFASLIKSSLEFPKGFARTLSIFLMIAIGLKGGVALSESSGSGVLYQSLVVISIGFILPLLAFPVLRYIGDLSRHDSASIAAHYGSVSVGTYAVAVAVLESQNIPYESYFPLFVVLLEAPAIAVGIALADKSLLKKSKALLYEIFSSEGIVLLSGGLLIGYLYGYRAENIMPLFSDLFHGVLALFLLHMGIVAGSKFETLRENGLFVLSFGIFMPLSGALLAGFAGYFIGLSTGGVILLAVLGASASYIAVPAAMAVALPQANQSLSITSSLAITFPFNVVVGIPVYIGVVQWLMS